MEISDIFARLKKITVLGLSPSEDRPSHYVSAYLQDHGFEISGVNPGHSEILGVKCYSSVSEVPDPIEIALVFRASNYLGEIVDQLIPRKPKVIWIQLGVEDHAAEERANAAGITVIRRKCMMVEHERRR